MFKMDNNLKYFIKIGKESISGGSIPRLKMTYQDIEEYMYYENKNLNIEYIFIQLYNTACLYSQKDIIIYLLSVYFEKINQISQLALRQHFYYGKHIIKDKTIKTWYSNYVIPIFKIY